MLDGIMKFLLIITILSSGYQSTSVDIHSIEFNSYRTCEAAKEAWIRNAKLKPAQTILGKKVERQPFDLKSAFCIRK